MNIPTLSDVSDVELTADERVTSVVNRTKGRRRLTLLQRLRRAAAKRLRQRADRLRDRRLARG